MVLVYMPSTSRHHGGPSLGCPQLGRACASQVRGFGYTVAEPVAAQVNAGVQSLQPMRAVLVPSAATARLPADVRMLPRQLLEQESKCPTTSSASSTVTPTDSTESSPRPSGLMVQRQGAVSSIDDGALGVEQDQLALLGEMVNGAEQAGWCDACDEEPRSGAEVRIGCYRFLLQKMIGQGAFGVVWRSLDLSRLSGNRVAAVKIMNTRTQEDLEMAVFEAELLRRLKTQLSAVSSDRVPQYIAHSTTLTSCGGIVNLAMSFIPGMVLDQWLYGINDEEHKQIDVSQIVRGVLPGSRMHSMPLAGACAFAGHLISQLATVFAALQPVAFHRDVSSHNVLVDISINGELQVTAGESPRPSFALIDFGLAVRSDTWHQEWSESNLAGDPRYWMPPAWMAFAFGFECVENHPNRSFHRQYLGRIDHYSLGILGLEVLFALWDVENRFDEERAPGMLEARELWCSFWEAMFSLFQMFHMQGPEETRQYLESTADDRIARITEVLKQVQQALRVAEADPANASRAALLHILADLVDEHGVLDWAEIPAMFGVKPEPEPQPTRLETVRGLRSNGDDMDVPANAYGPVRSWVPPQTRSWVPPKIDGLLRSLENGCSLRKLPEVTRYELLPASNGSTNHHLPSSGSTNRHAPPSGSTNHRSSCSGSTNQHSLSSGSTNHHSSSMNTLTQVNSRPARSITQEQSVRLYTKSMPRARSLSPERASHPYPLNLPQQSVPAGVYSSGSVTRTSSLVRTYAMSAMTERAASYVPPVVAASSVRPPIPRNLSYSPSPSQTPSFAPPPGRATTRTTIGLSHAYVAGHTGCATRSRAVRRLS